MKTTSAILSDIGGGNECNYDEFLAGIAANLYAVDPDFLKVRPAYAKDGSSNYQSYSFDKANFKTGKYALKFKIKKDSGQNQATGIDGAKGYNQSLTFTIEKDVKKASQVLRAIKNHEDYYFLCEEADAESFQVVGDPVRGSRLNNNYDSGTTPESDSGLQCTVTAASRFSVAWWTPATEAASFDDTLPTGITALTGELALSTNVENPDLAGTNEGE